MAIYTIQPGDTLYSIATYHRTTMDALIRVNGLEGPNLYAGQSLIVPPVEQFTPRPPPYPTGPFPPGPGPVPGPGPYSPDLLEQRVTRLERQFRQLEREVDRLQFRVNLLEARVDRLERPSK